MPDSSGPWDGAPWAEADWFRTMAQETASGVHGTTPATSAMTGSLAFASSGLVITPAAGRATVGGAGYVRTAALTTVTATANTHASFNRRDRLVLRRSLSTHTVSLAIIAGTAAASPVAPSITRDDTTWDLPLFSFLVPPASGTTISGVQDERVWLGGAARVSVANQAVLDSLGSAAGPTGVTYLDAATRRIVTLDSVAGWLKVGGPVERLVSSGLDQTIYGVPAGSTSVVCSATFTMPVGGNVYLSGSAMYGASGNAAGYFKLFASPTGAIVQANEAGISRVHLLGTGYNTYFPGNCQGQILLGAGTQTASLTFAADVSGLQMGVSQGLIQAWF